MRCNAKIRAVSLITLCCLAHSGWSAALLPGSASPEQVSKALSEGPVPPSQETKPPVVVEPEKGPPISEQAKKIKFVLNGIRFKGNTVYTDRQLLPLYKDKLHKQISVADLFLVVQDITNFYRNNGYILSRAILPPQHVKGGIIEVQIIEGYINQVTVSGTPGRASKQIYAFGNKITTFRPIAIKNMERYLLLANEIPGASVKSVLAPSKTAAGAADLDLISTFSPVTGYISYDNYGTRYIGPQQMTANLDFNSVLFSGDATAFTLTKTPRGGELLYRDVNYSMPLDAEGDRWLIGATHARTHPQFVLTPQETHGVNENIYTMFIFPVIRTRSESLNLRAGFNYQDSHVNQLGSELYTDHIRTISFGLTYNFSDKYYGANLISFDYRQGLPIFGYSSDTDPLTAQTSRPGGTAVYTKFLLTLSRVQAVYGPFSLYGVLNGQWTPQALLSSEQFAFGGSVIGRGYDIAELIGDRGFSGSIEARLDRGVGRWGINNIQLYAFYDGGIVWNYTTSTNLPTQQSGLQRKDSGTSAGFGLRFFFTRILSGNVMWAQPLTHKVQTETQTQQVIVNNQILYTGNGWRPRMFFSVIAALD